MPKSREAVQGWRAICDEETARPKKSELLERAVEHLGPFVFETSAEAIADGKTFEHSGKRFGISREMAVELVEDIARRFNAEEHLHAGAPRAKDLDDQLTALKDQTESLARLIQSLNDDTLGELHRDVSVKSQEIPPIRKAEEDFMLPKPTSDAAETGGKTLDELLLALSEHASRTRENWRRRRQRRGRAIEDRGGNTNLWKEHAGSPRAGLVNDTFRAYDTFKPGMASGHVNPGHRSQDDGTYRAFVLDVFEYATGKDAGEGQLDELIKKQTKALREFWHVDRRSEELQAEWRALIGRMSPDSTDEERSRLAEIEEEQIFLCERTLALTRRLWPHHFSKRQ